MSLTYSLATADGRNNQSRSSEKVTQDENIATANIRGDSVQISLENATLISLTPGRNYQSLDVSMPCDSVSSFEVVTISMVVVV